MFLFEYMPNNIHLGDWHDRPLQGTGPIFGRDARREGKNGTQKDRTIFKRGVKIIDENKAEKYQIPMQIWVKI